MSPLHEDMELKTGMQKLQFKRRTERTKCVGLIYNLKLIYLNLLYKISRLARTSDSDRMNESPSLIINIITEAKSDLTRQCTKKCSQRR